MILTAANDCRQSQRQTADICRCRKAALGRVPIEETRKITIGFHEVEYFSASGGDAIPIDDDSSVIQSIGTVDLEADTQAFYLTDNIQPDHHLVMRFESGLTLRVQAVEARCEIIF